MKKTIKFTLLLTALLAALLLMTSCSSRETVVIYVTPEPGSQYPAQPTTAPGGRGQQVERVQCNLCAGNRTCWKCGGSGRDNGYQCRYCSPYGSGNCSACLGNGYRNTVYVNGVEYLECSGCHGSKECSSCNGTGRNNYSGSGWDVLDGKCGLCFGGKTCTVCEGRGYVNPPMTFSR